MADTYKILLVGLEDPEKAIAEPLLATAGRTVQTADDPAEAEALAKDFEPQLVFMRVPGTADALPALGRMQRITGQAPMVLLADNPSVALTLDLWHHGAADLITLPLTAQALEGSLSRFTGEPPVPAPKEPTGVGARLRYLDAAGKEHWVGIIPPRFTIGRSSDNDLVLPQMNISRAHAEILVEGEQYTLRDLGSRHGTLVNGTRIDRVRLADGDRIQLGGQHGQALTFHPGDLLQSLLSRSEVGSQAGLSIRGFREMGLLLGVVRALSSIPLLDDLLSLVVDTAIELTGAERGFIMLQEQDGSLSFRCARNNNKQPLDGTSFKTSRRVPNEVFETGRRVAINDLDLGEQDEHSSTRQLGVRSIVCVPLRYWAYHDAGSNSTTGKVETIGVLYVDSPSIAERLSETQLDALDTLATEAAMAIYNARLYKESQEKRKMDEELAIAREIQQSLLPPAHRALPYVQAFSQNLPCREVGGDYFDYFELPGGRLGFTLGDVAGKGMPAALLTSMIQGLFAAQAQLDLPLPLLISNVNKSLAQRGPGNRFVTLFFGVLDAEGNFTYTNAGHNPPYVVGRDGSLCTLTEGGMVLGLFNQAAYESKTVRLSPGDHLVLFTDGVIEARNLAGEEYGEERLCALLKGHARSCAADVLSAIQNNVTEFSAGAPQHDDITMMVLGFREPPIET